MPHGSRSRVTTEQAPTDAPSPIVTPGNTTQLQTTSANLPTITGARFTLRYFSSIVELANPQSLKSSEPVSILLPCDMPEKSPSSRHSPPVIVVNDAIC